MGTYRLQSQPYRRASQLTCDLAEFQSRSAMRADRGAADIVRLHSGASATVRQHVYARRPAPVQCRSLSRTRITCVGDFQDSYQACQRCRLGLTRRQSAKSFSASNALSSTPRVWPLRNPSVRDRQRGRPLAKRVRDNDEALLDAYRVIAAAIKDKRPITPAAEWLIDNFHLAEDQIREIRTDLPPSYYRQLPKLAEGPFKGYPRIFEVAWAFVAHTDSRFEAEMLRRFVLAYQRVQPLTIGELWALAITIRVVLVENLRRLADLIVGSQTSRDAADALADRLLGVSGSGLLNQQLRRCDRSQTLHSPGHLRFSLSNDCAMKIRLRRRHFCGWTSA